MISRRRDNKVEVVKRWLTGQHSCTLIIPRELAIDYRLDEPSHVILQKTPVGLLFRRLNFEETKENNSINQGFEGQTLGVSKRS
jgi:hypothetical protein